MTQLSINPETLRIEGAASGRFSAEEFAELIPPSCPVCGTMVGLQQIDVTLSEQDLIENGRSYMIGLWDCPRGCNPRAASWI